MADGDAEWIDVHRIPELPSRPGPNRPPPRPRTLAPPPGVTKRPRRIPWDGEGRPRRPLRPRRPHDAPEMVPPTSGSSNNVTIISVSVVSVLILLALASLLLYLFVLKKKLRKVRRSQSDAQFCLRVQDVAHLDVDDSSSMYVNTTDLQRLVSSIRMKNKKPPPPLPMKANDTSFVSISKPIQEFSQSIDDLYDNPCLESGFDNSSSNIPSTMESITTNPLHEEASDDFSVYSDIVMKTPSSTSVRRPALPPPPVPKKNNGNDVSKSSYGEVSVNTSDSQFKLKPPHKPLHKPLLLTNEHKSVEVDKFIQIKELEKPKPKPPTNPKPNLAPTNPLINKFKDINMTNTTKKPILPPLKMNLRPTLRPQDSNSTPETASSYLTDNDTPNISNAPEALSVKEKKALLESAFTGDSLR